MSISRLVLSSPFDIPPKPRVVATVECNHRRNVNSNGSTNNIMSDSRVVRRSSFSPSVPRRAEIKNNWGELGGDVRRSQCVIFDSRLFNRNVFASPIVTVIDAKNENVAAKSKSPKKRIKSPIVAKVHHNVHVQTDDIISTNSKERTYSESSAQTDIRCSFEDTREENPARDKKEISEGQSAEEEQHDDTAICSTDQNDSETNKESQAANAEQTKNKTAIDAESHVANESLVQDETSEEDVDESLEKFSSDQSEAENIAPRSETKLADTT